MNRDELLSRYANGDRDFRGVNLSGVDLRGVNLSGADLRGADLIGTDMRYADLTLATLSGAVIRLGNRRIVLP